MKIALVVTMLSLAALADEHVLIHPLEGSTPAGREVSKSQRVALPNGAGGKTLEVQGTVSRYVWKNPKGKAAQEIAAAYDKELSQAGFKALYACAGKECGAIDLKAFGKIPADAGASYSLGQLRRRELGDAYGALLVGAAQTTLLIVEQSATPEQREAAVKEAVAAAQRVTAGGLGEALAKEGHVALGDILYRPGEVALRPEAQSVVKEIAGMLAANPQLKLYVVGHTDSQGEFSQNIGVSRKRAAWLVKELIKQGVPGTRLRPDGVGPLAPVADNGSEEGRSRNRRVELVRQ